MILDYNLLFSNNQSLVATAGAILSDKSIDMWNVATQAKDALGNTPVLDWGRGGPIEVLAQVTETFTSTSSDVTCVFALVMADDAALTSNLVVLYQTPAIACATLVAGYMSRISSTLPPGLSKRYLGMRYTTAVHDATAGKVTSGLLWNRQSVSI